MEIKHREKNKSAILVALTSYAAILVALTSYAASDREAAVAAHQRSLGAFK